MFCCLLIGIVWLYLTALVSFETKSAVDIILSLQTMAHSISVPSFLSALVANLTEPFITRLIQEKHIRLLGPTSKYPGCLAVSITNLCGCIPQSPPQPLLDIKHARRVAEILDNAITSTAYMRKAKMTLTKGQHTCLIFHWHAGALQADKVRELLTFDERKPKRVRLTLHICSSMPKAYLL